MRAKRTKRNKTLPRNQLVLFFVCPECNQEVPGYMRRERENNCLRCKGDWEENRKYLARNAFAKTVKPPEYIELITERKIKYLFKRGIRARLKDFFKQNGIKRVVNKWIGCDLPTFRAYIESKFHSGMTWENYGREGWHLDHIKPITKFDLTSDEEIAKINLYTNLQPLWALDNYKKSNKYDSNSN